MRKGQKYVVQATTKTSGTLHGLGHDYRKGDYVTYDGSPTRRLDEAYVYTHGNNEEEFPFDESPHLRKWFTERQVKLVTIVRLDEEPKPAKRKRVDMGALRRKAYHPKKLTDRELAQVIRSSGTGATLRAKVAKEMDRRGLLDENGREKYGRISDYIEGVTSPRIQ